MTQRSPKARLAPAQHLVGGTPGSVERGDATREYQTHAQLEGVPGPQHEARLALGGTARRSLLRTAADSEHHERFMAAACGSQYIGAKVEQGPAQHPPQWAQGTAVPDSSALRAVAGSSGDPGRSGGGAGAVGGSLCASSLAGQPSAELAQEEALLAEASSCSSDAQNNAGWVGKQQLCQLALLCCSPLIVGGLFQHDGIWCLEAPPDGEAYLSIVYCG
jgi:hypothetical protein